MRRENPLWIIRPPFSQLRTGCSTHQLEWCVAVMRHFYTYCSLCICSVRHSLQVPDTNVSTHREANALHGCSSQFYVMLYFWTQTLRPTRGVMVPDQTSLERAWCDSDRPLSLRPTDWSFTHNNLHGNQSSCLSNCLLTVSPSAWCESGGCLGDNPRESAGVSDLYQGQRSLLFVSFYPDLPAVYLHSYLPSKKTKALFLLSNL